MHRFYVKYDGSNVVRFNWPGDPVTEWATYECKYPINSEGAAYNFIEWLFDYNGYLSVLYSSDWEAVIIEEDHDN